MAKINRFIASFSDNIRELGITYHRQYRNSSFLQNILLPELL